MLNKRWLHGSLFPFTMWLLSRLVIVITLIVTLYTVPPDDHPRLPPNASPDTFILIHWDGLWYEKIASQGYEYANDLEKHSVAFFPLFPLIARALICTGLPFEVAGPLINNLAFLGALYLIYGWVQRSQNVQTARWTVAALAWFPHSLFGSLAYTEGLFLLLSTASLRAFDRCQYGQMAMFGALATATRPTGLVLAPTLLIAAWRERRPPIAYIAGIGVSAGVLLYSLYCALQFHDPLAFLHAQRGWRSTFGFDIVGWLTFLSVILAGTGNQLFTLKGLIGVSTSLVLLLLGYLLWRNREKLSAPVVEYGSFALFFLLWLFRGDTLLRVLLAFGSLYLFWKFRRQLRPVVQIFGYAGMALVLNTGSGITIMRLAYGISALPIALGTLLARYPRLGFCTIGFFMVLLINFCNRFASYRFMG